MPTNSLERALSLLEEVEQTPGGLSSSEIQRRLAIPKSTCNYITKRLTQRGFLAQDPKTGRHRIGLTTIALAYGALREITFRRIAEPTLYRLSRETGLSASLGVLERGRVLLVDRIENPAFPPSIRDRRQRDIGRELPVHSNALGKVLVAYQEEPVRSEILDNSALTPCTSRTITEKESLREELEVVRRRGYAESNEEHYIGVKAVGAPVFDSERSVSAAISVTGDPKDRCWDETERVVHLVRLAGFEISRQAFRTSAYS